MNETKTIKVFRADGKKTDSVELPGDLFDVQTNVPLIHQVVVAQQAAARQGTHATKTRGDVRGGGAKPWRQKGTGRARQGSRRAPQWAGGGIAHGPQPHGYAQRTPKKMIAAALRGALSDRAREDQLFVVDYIIDGETPSTKQALAALGSIAEYMRILVVLDRDDYASFMSLRNVPGVHVLAVDQLNAYDVLVADAVVFTRASLDVYVTGPTRGKGAKAVATEDEAALDDAIFEAPEAEVATVAADADEAEVADEPKDYGEGSFRGEKAPKGFTIKGNEDSMLFHTEESPYYSRTKAELWFNSVEAAEAAGFSSAQGDAGAEEDDEK